MYIKSGRSFVYIENHKKQSDLMGKTKKNEEENHEKTVNHNIITCTIGL